LLRKTKRLGQRKSLKKAIFLKAMKIKIKFTWMFVIIILLLAVIVGILSFMFCNNWMLLQRTRTRGQTVFLISKNNVLFMRLLRANFMFFQFADMSDSDSDGIVGSLENDLNVNLKALTVLLNSCGNYRGVFLYELSLTKDKVQELKEESDFLMERLKFARMIFHDGRRQEALDIITGELTFKIDRILLIFKQLQSIETDLYVRDVSSLSFMNYLLDIRNQEKLYLQSSVFQFYPEVLNIHSAANKVVLQFMYYLFTGDTYDKIVLRSLSSKLDEFLEEWEDRISVELEKASLVSKGGVLSGELWKEELELQKGILYQWSELQDIIDKSVKLQDSHKVKDVEENLRNLIFPLIDGSFEKNIGSSIQREREESRRLFNSFKESNNYFLRFLLFTFGFVLLVVLTVTLKVLYSILIPLRSLSAGIERIAGGDLNYEIRLKQRDEFARIAVLFNGMAESLRKARDKIIAEKKFSANIVSALKEGLVVIDPEGIIVMVSPFFCNLLGYLEKEILGRPLIEFVVDAETFRKKILNNLGTGFIEEIKELECIDKSGIKIITSFSCSIIYNSDRSLAHLVCVFSDIRQANMLEKATFRNAQFQKIINSMLTYSLRDIGSDELLLRCLAHVLSFPLVKAGAIFLADDSGNFILKAHLGLSELFVKECSVMAQGASLFGESALNRKVSFFPASNDLKKASYLKDSSVYSVCVAPVMYADNLIGKFYLFFPERLSIDEQAGQEFFFRMFSYTIAEIMKRKDSERELKATYEQLKQLQSQLVQSEKMAAIGQLAGGVAHEINNPLTGVLNNAQLIKMMLADAQTCDLAQFKELLDIIEESSLRCKNITTSLLEFSHASMGAFKDVNLNEVINKVIFLVQKELNLQNITVEKHLEDKIPLIKADPQLLQQIIVSLISNAKWAVDKQFSGSGEGKIVLTTLSLPQGKWVDILVSDNGIGVPKDKMGKLFEPFFTTKQVGEGTGLGLSVVYNIIKKHKGEISVESREHQGTVFKISFPVA